MLEAHANLKIANLRERQSPDLYSDYEDATPAEVQMIPIQEAATDQVRNEAITKEDLL